MNQATTILTRTRRQQARSGRQSDGIDILSHEEVSEWGASGFYQRYFKPSRPAIIRGGMRLLGQASRWDLGYFTTVFGTLPIGVIESSAGKTVSYAIDNQPRFMSFRELSELMAGSRSENGRNYFSITGVNLRNFPHLSAHTLFDELKLDCLVPSRMIKSASMRFGTGGTDSALHFDGLTNLSGQITGSKRWTIYDPQQNDYLAYMDGTDFRSRINPDGPDFDAFPAFRNARPTAEFVLGTGDLLFLPPFWWHRVVALSPSASLRVEMKTSLRDWLNNPTARGAIQRVARRHFHV